MECSSHTYTAMLGIFLFRLASLRPGSYGTYQISKRKSDTEKRMWLSGPGKIAASTAHFGLLLEEDTRKRGLEAIALARFLFVDNSKLCCFRLDKVIR
jgi:hypothetical protein